MTTKNNKILTVYKDDLNFEFLSKLLIDTKFEIQMQKNDLFKEHVELGIVAFINNVPNVGNLGICIIRKKDRDIYLEYYANPKEQFADMEIRTKSFNKLSSLAGETYVIYINNNGGYEELVKNIKFDEIRKNPVGSIFSPTTVDYVPKQQIIEEQYATLMYKDQDGVILKFMKTKQQDHVHFSSEEWIEWVSFPKEKKK